MTRDAVLSEALKLAVEERAEVAVELLASLDGEGQEDPEEVERAWGAEIERRALRVLAGESEGTPWEEVKQRLGRSLPKS